MSQPIRNGPRQPRARGPVIFLVDDQPLLLDLAESSLQGQDYQLRKFLDPELALAAFARARPKPALLITDYAMGKMNGLELIERCKALKPDLKSILISGTAGAEIILESNAKIDRFMGKPYQPANLADLVRRIIASPAGAGPGAPPDRSNGG